MTDGRSRVVPRHGRRGADPWIGRVIDGRYAIGEPIGRGATSNVYRAFQRSLGREVAIKLCSQRPAAPEAVARFANEARLLGLVAPHPQAVCVFDVGVTGAGAPYLVTELVQGRTLAEVLRQEGALAVGRATGIARDIAGLLAAAHFHDIVHRDLKPANVMLSSERSADELVKVVDFGLATRRDDQATLPDRLCGTPGYMAPEIIAGEPASPASDVYSLGVVLYQMLSGHPPFAGTVAEVLAGHLYDSPPPLPAPLEVAELVGCLLRRDPAARPTAARAGETLAGLVRTAPAQGGG